MRKLNKSQWPYTMIVSGQEEKEVFKILEQLGVKYKDWFAFSIYDNQSCVAVRSAEDYAFLKLRFPTCYANY